MIEWIMQQLSQKIYGNLHGTTAHYHLAKISLRTSFASQTSLLEYKFLQKTEEFNRKITQKDNLLAEIIGHMIFYIAAVISLPAPMVTKKPS